MARGYSASRHNGRATLRLKRERSASVHALKNATTAAAKATATATTSDDSTSSSPVAQRKVRVVRPRRLGSVSAESRSASIAALKERISGVKKDKKASGADEEEEQQQGKSSSGRTASSKTSASAARSKSMTLRNRIEAAEDGLADLMEGSEDDEETVQTPDVMVKYKSAGRAIDEVLDIVSAACLSGINTKTLCDQADAEILERLKHLFSKVKGPDGKRIPRGIAYPTNVSVNQVLCNHSPFREEEGVVLKGGDVVKIHLGCHLDGYPVSAARTIVVPASATEVAAGSPYGNFTREASNAVEAARVALTGMIHKLRPGALNADITDFVARVGNSFEVEAVEGVLSNRTKRWVPDGLQCIIGRRVTTEDPHQDVADCTIGTHQVWTLDIAFTTAQTHRMMLSDEPTNLFRRTPEDFPLDARVQRAGEVLTEVTDKHHCFPFHFKDLAEPLKAKMGIQVLMKKGVVDRLPSLKSKGNKSITTRFSATVAVTAKRVTVLCGAPPAAPLSLPSELAPNAILDDIAEVLMEPLDFATQAAMRRREAGAAPPQKRARAEKVEESEE